MVLMWFDLSTRDSKVSHVTAYVSRRGQFVLLVVSTGQRWFSAIRFFVDELQLPYIAFTSIWKIALEQVSFSIYITDNG